MKLFEEIAVALAEALVASDFGRAREMLAPDLRESLSEDGLREQLVAMYRVYSDNEPTSTELVPDGSLASWPGKVPATSAGPTSRSPGTTSTTASSCW